MTDRRAKLLKLHERILAGDPSASSELFSAIHRPLVGVLLKLYRGGGLGPEDASDVATDAVIEYLRQPQKFSPERASLYSYLAMFAKGDGLNLLQSRRRVREGTKRFVELSKGSRNMEGADIDINLDADAIIKRYGAGLVDDMYDFEVLRLMLLGEKDTEIYASAIGLGTAERVEKIAAVKLRRDKLEKRLSRLRERL
jgi:DNA-directed RNA polymerase specialized sigma24 family protein